MVYKGAVGKANEAERQWRRQVAGVQRLEEIYRRESERSRKAMETTGFDKGIISLCLRVGKANEAERQWRPTYNGVVVSAIHLVGKANEAERQWRLSSIKRPAPWGVSSGKRTKPKGNGDR